jgi:thiamine biosynthesis lipoprotein
MDLEYVTRVGEAEIDLGGIAKGYALDIAKQYLDSKKVTKYIIDAGSSSILLGEKDTKDGLFNIGLKDIKNAYLKAKNCFVSTSGTSEQLTVIDGVKYSHIVNPKTGSVVSLHVSVIE